MKWGVGINVLFMRSKGLFQMHQLFKLICTAKTLSTKLTEEGCDCMHKKPLISHKCHLYSGSTLENTSCHVIFCVYSVQW